MCQLSYALVDVNSQGPPPRRAYPGDSDIRENVLSEFPLWVKVPCHKCISAFGCII